MSPEEALIKSRKLIEDPAAWIKGESCCDAQNIPHLAGHPDAVKFCAYGALAHVCGASTKQPGWDELFEACGGGPIEFNDSHTHSEVLAAFDRAIQIARAKGATP